MSLEFKYYKINDIGEVVSGGTPSTSKNEYWYGDIGWITPKDLSSYDDIYISRGERNISSEGLNNSSAKLVPKNTVLMTSRAPIGYIAIANNELSTNQGFKSLICNEKICHYKYFYYWLKLNIKYIINNSNGSTFKEISGGTFKNLELSLPSLNEQKAISSVLWTIDEKISVLKRINKNLEKTLITIFNSWFINFENYDNSKGMKIDESYGEIPVDWSVEMLEDYVDFVTGVEPGSKNYHEKPEPHDIPFLRVGDLGSRDNGVFIDPSLSKNKILKYDDIVLSLDATIGIVKMGLEGAYSTGMRKLVIKNDNINQPFLYCLVKSNRIQRIIETFATGTTILHAGKSIKHMNFVLSDKKTMDDFGKIGNPIISIILTNLKEIEYLTNLRDTLLPKLMSGEIDVSKINCDLKIIIRKIYIKSSKLFLWRYLSENQNYIKNTKSNETLLKSRTIHKINKFLAKFNARYRYYRQ